MLKEKSFTCLLAQLPSALQHQVLKFRKWEDQQRSLLGKILLAQGLQSLDLTSYSLNDLKYTRFLKPYFDDSIDFNISHSGEYVVCAISRIGKVGIDVEEIKSISLYGFESQFSDNEWKQVSEAENRLLSFYTLWTQKEAFIKAIGTGLNIPLNEVAIKENKISWDNTLWFLHEVTLDHRYVSHLSTNQLLPKIVIQKVNF